MKYRAASILSVLIATTPAAADDAHHTHDAPFVAIDFGAEVGHDAVATTGFLVGIESNSNNFLVSAALTRSHGHTSFGDIAFGYYRSFHLGWLTPELGAEIGLLNEEIERDGHRTHHVTLLERVGGALLHHFDNHMFVGLVSDVNFAADHPANIRGLFELGYQL